MMKRSINVYLHEELIRQILLWLPVKALLRFKCVCKEWCGVIGSRSFVDDHYGHESNPDCHLIQFTPTRTGHEFAVCGDDGRHLRSGASRYLSQMRKCNDLMGPENGIFCAVGVDEFKRGVSFALLNPATKKLKPLPPIPLPIVECFLFGFGFVPFSGEGDGDGDGDFKVAAFLKTVNSQTYLCVYNSSTGYWRITAQKVFDWMNERMISEFHGGEFLNGVYYWFGENISVLGFDMRSESFHEILVPDAMRNADFEDVDLSAYDDSLALLHEKEVATSFDFWVMERDGFWTKRFSFGIDLPLPLLDCFTIFVWNKNELLIDSKTKTRRKYTSSLFLYDISTQKLRKFGPEIHAVSYFIVYSYKESLVSIQGETDSGDFVHHFFN